MVTIMVPREDAENPGLILYVPLDDRAVAVHDHKFSAGPFKMNGSSYDRGTYVVSVIIANFALPDSVMPVLGDIGEKMSGPNVKEESAGALLFEVRQTFEIR